MLGVLPLFAFLKAPKRIVLDYRRAPLGDLERRCTKGRVLVDGREIDNAYLIDTAGLVQYYPVEKPGQIAMLEQQPDGSYDLVRAQVTGKVELFDAEGIQIC